VAEGPGDQAAIRVIFCDLKHDLAHDSIVPDPDADANDDVLPEGVGRTHQPVISEVQFKYHIGRDRLSRLD
jgi:hypothetical protein